MATTTTNYKRIDEQFPASGIHRIGVEYPIYGEGSEQIGIERFVTDTRLDIGLIKRGKYFAAFNPDGTLSPFVKEGWWYEQSRHILVASISDEHESRYGCYTDGKREGTWICCGYSHDHYREVYQQFLRGKREGPTTEVKGQWVIVGFYNDSNGRIGVWYSRRRDNGSEILSLWAENSKLRQIAIRPEDGAFVELGGIRIDGVRSIHVEYVTSIESFFRQEGYHRIDSNGWVNYNPINLHGIGYSMNPEMDWHKLIQYNRGDRIAKLHVYPSPEDYVEFAGQRIEGFRDNTVKSFKGWSLTGEKDDAGRYHGMIRGNNLDGSWSEITYVHGVRHGPYTEYFVSNGWTNTGKYVDGNKHGVTNSVNDDGRRNSCLFVNGKIYNGLRSIAVSDRNGR